MTPRITLNIQTLFVHSVIFHRIHRDIIIIEITGYTVALLFDYSPSQNANLIIISFYNLVQYKINQPHQLKSNQSNWQLSFSTRFCFTLGQGNILSLTFVVLLLCLYAAKQVNYVGLKQFGKLKHVCGIYLCIYARLHHHQQLIIVYCKNVIVWLEETAHE